MGASSKIEWTDSSWNPIRARNKQTGKIGWHCEHVTTGCEHCYAESINRRLGTGLPFKPGHLADIEIFLDQQILQAPLAWKRPRKVFLGSMTDIFAEFVPTSALFSIFEMIADCPQHTFQVLTKRPARMRDFIFDFWNYAALDRLPNVWLGVSCERQQEADVRIPLLLQTPAAVRFLSCEPLLGPINIWNSHVVRIAGDAAHKAKPDFVIVGGESGPGARPMDPQWAIDIREQCKDAGAAFFFKQWGGRRKAADRRLDGREHNDFPGRAA